MADRRCEQCNGSVPNRMSRTRNDKGQLVCEECKGMTTPEWTAGLRYAASMGEESEMRRRIAAALASMARVRRAEAAGISVLAHDSGDNAIINHCPFCGSGAVVGSGDGTVSCDFCHTNFTVQVQPAHPFMPQTVNGQPVPPAGMPGDQPTEMSAPLDPAVNETEEGVVEEATGAQPFNAPQATPTAPEKADKPSGGSQPPWLKNKASARTAGFSEPEDVMCPHCHREMGWYDDELGNTCPHCGKAVTQKPAPSPEDLDRDHIPVSVGGWTCDICGVPVNGQTDDNGVPVQRGDSVRHTGKRTYATAEGHILDEDAYMARLALEHADDKAIVLDAVRHTHMEKQADLLTVHDNPADYPDPPDLLVHHDPPPARDLLDPYDMDRWQNPDLLADNGHTSPDQFRRTPAEWREMLREKGWRR